MLHPLKCLWGITVAVLLLALQCSSSPLERRVEPTCTDIIISVTISADNAGVNVLLAETLPIITFFNSLLDSVFFFTVPVQGTYSISARYCEPASQYYNASRYDTLQVLVHGVTYDKNYWSGDGAPGQSYGGGDQYSWVSYAATQGYPTLAIDRLGCGNSTHPAGTDPILVVQTPAEVEILHQIILQSRAGNIPSTRAFNTIILAGHSYGSFISNALNQKYPNDVEVTLLTGFSSKFKTAIPALLPLVVPLPATNFPFGYYEFASQAGVTEFFFYSSGPGMGYDPALAAYDFSIRGTLTTGELVSVLFGIVTASSYTKPVYLVTGAHDYAFCNPLGLPDAADCSPSGPGYLNWTQALYPAASVFQWYAPPNSGHCWHLHYDAYDTFINIHNWLAAQGF